MSRFFHPIPVLLVRLGLGITLLVASWHKIADPTDFAKVIHNYKIFPSPVINLLAIYVPWVEVFAGLALVTGFGRRGASLLVALLFAAFIAALSYNLSRNCPTICGCFDTYASGTAMTIEEKFSKMRGEILLDAGLLALSLYVFAASWVPRSKGGPAGSPAASAA